MDAESFTDTGVGPYCAWKRPFDVTVGWPTTGSGPKSFPEYWRDRVTMRYHTHTVIDYHLSLVRTKWPNPDFCNVITVVDHRQTFNVYVQNHQQACDFAQNVAAHVLIDMKGR